MKKVTRKNNLKSKLLEQLEDRRLMSASVQLVDGMLVLQGTTRGHNRLTVSPDSNGTTLYARADGVRKHYLMKDVQSIRIVGGDKPDQIAIDQKIKDPSFIRTGGGADSVAGGGGSDTVMGGAGNDTLSGGGGDDLLLGQGGSNKINAGNGDNANTITPVHHSDNSTSVTKFNLIDAKTNEVIATLGDGSTINLAKLPDRLNVQAIVSSGGEDGSVMFSYDGQETRVENHGPFALAADDGSGDFYGWTPRAGTHTLSATPYAGKDATGADGTALNVTFAVINDQDAPEVTAGATPASNDNSNDNSGGTSDDNSNDQGNQVNAPVAAIDLIDSEVPAGTSVFANALKTQLKTGNVLGATFSWDFGDPGSKYNTLTGFNVAHAYTKAGTYKIKLTVTDSAGKSNTVTQTVKIDDANRKFIYVSPSGNDSNNGSSQSNAVKTFARAAELVGDNTEVLFQRGHTYTTSECMQLGFNNVEVGAYGSGASPIIRYTGGMDHNAVFGTMGGKNILIHNLGIDSASTTLDDQGYVDGVRIGGQNITVRDCSFINAGYAINTNGFPDGVLIQDNISPNANSIRMYFAWVQGKDQVYLGNTSKDSIHGHNLRIGGADNVNLQYNNFTNLAETGGLRGTMTIHTGNYIYVAHNTLNVGALGLGPLDRGPEALAVKDERLNWVVVEDNTVNATLKIGNGTNHVAVRNNVIHDDDDIAIDVPGYSATYERGTSDVTVDHNTIINNGKTGRAIKVGGPVTDFTLTHNLYVAPNLVTGSYNAAPVDILNKDLSGFKLIADNIWPSPTILDAAHGGINYVGADQTTNAGYKTPAEWDAYSVVQHEQFMDVTLTNSYMINAGGTTAGAAMKKAA